MVIGVLMGFDGDAPLVVFAGNPREAAVPARSLAALDYGDGRRGGGAAVRGRATRRGRWSSAASSSPPGAARAPEVLRDGERVRVTAEERIELRGRQGVADHGEGRPDHHPRHLRHQPRQRRQPHPRRLGAPELMPRAPVLPEIVRQHAEMAAFLWTVYDHHLLHPDENPDMDEERLARLVERLEAHLDGLRVAGAEGASIAEERYAEYPEAGELFVLRMLSVPETLRIFAGSTLVKVRATAAASRLLALQS